MRGRQLQEVRSLHCCQMLTVAGISITCTRSLSYIAQCRASTLFMHLIWTLVTEALLYLYFVGASINSFKRTAHHNGYALYSHFSCLEEFLHASAAIIRK